MPFGESMTSDEIAKNLLEGKTCKNCNKHAIQSWGSTEGDSGSEEFCTVNRVIPKTQTCIHWAKPYIINV